VNWKNLLDPLEIPAEWTTSTLKYGARRIAVDQGSSRERAAAQRASSAYEALVECPQVDRERRRGHRVLLRKHNCPGSGAQRRSPGPSGALSWRARQHASGGTDPIVSQTNCCWPTILSGVSVILPNPPNPGYPTALPIFRVSSDRDACSGGLLNFCSTTNIVVQFPYEAISPRIAVKHARTLPPEVRRGPAQPRQALPEPRRGPARRPLPPRLARWQRLM
jgi:hypothetical protein